MKVGIFIPGLGEAFQGTSVKGYADRLASEMDHNNPQIGPQYYTKEEKIEYGKTTRYNSTCITIFSKIEGIDKAEYKLYDLKYAATLTEEFTQKSVIGRCLSLFGTVVFKSPILFRRIFKSNSGGYQSQRLRLLSFYTFGIFFIMALAGIIMIPAAITLLDQITSDKAVAGWLTNYPKLMAFGASLKTAMLAFVSVVLIVFSLAPAAQTAITSLAAEFSCVDKYFEYGARSQAVMGQLNELVEEIAEIETSKMLTDIEKDAFRIQLHAYSFGSIIALDLLYPFSSEPSNRVKNVIECLITIGCPYEFIESYYQLYFKKRKISLSSFTSWINVHSKADALSSNFRKDAQAEVPEYTFCEGCLFPVNIEYNLVNNDPTGLWNFLTLYSIKAHQFYWQSSPGGQNCLASVYKEMKKQLLIT